MTTRKLCLAGLGICVALGIIGVGRIPASTQTKSDQPKAPDIETITAEELKAKVVKKEPVTIIDVRASDAYVSSENKIEGAIFVRFRRLKIPTCRSRLSRMFLATGKSLLTAPARTRKRASAPRRLFLEAGFQRVRVLKGGWQAWLKANGGMESQPKGP